MRSRSTRQAGFGRRLALGAVLAASLVLGLQSTALASLQIGYTLSGQRAAYSADGLGSLAGTGLIQANVPAGSTVQKAFLYQTFFFNTTPSAAQRTVNFDGTNVTTTQLAHAAPGPCCGLASSRADVTSQVAAKVGGGSGITNFTATYDNSTSDGVGLVVVYTNPALPVATVAVLDGGAEQSGDTTTFNFLSPINKGAGFVAEMSLGSGFSFQNGQPGHICGGGQFSIVDVNAQRLTSCAGNFDDGEAGNGALMTVGGVGDSTDNPANPNSSNSGTDDELYNLDPFIANGNTQLVINTSNPSGDDILFLSVIRVTAAAAVTTEICNNQIDDDGDGLVDQADPDCQPPQDRVPPSCVLTTTNGTDASGRKFIEVTVRDQGSGLASVVVNKSTNSTTVVPPFAPGTTDPVVIRSTKIVQTQSSQLQLTVTDVAGNKTVCDPTSLVVKRKRGKIVSQKLRLPAIEHKVIISNGKRGLKRLDIKVNGRTWKVRLKPKQRKTISVKKALKPGAANYTMRLTPRGPVGANAFVLVAD